MKSHNGEKLEQKRSQLIMLQIEAVHWKNLIIKIKSEQGLQ